MRKKSLSWLLVIAMMLSLMPFSAMTAYAAAEGEWTYTLYDGDTTAAITGYTGTNTEIVIPSTIAGKPVTRIGSNAFLDDTVVTSVTIPDSVLRIESGAFQNSMVNTIDLGNGLTYIGQNAFNGSKIVNVTIPYSVTQIDNNAFANNRNLTSVIINGNNLMSLGDGAFSITGLSTVRIPTSLSTIGDWTFNDTYLNSLTIPANITNIGYLAFGNNPYLNSVLFEGNAPTMANCVFSIPSSGFTVYYYSGATGFTTPTWTAGSVTYNAVALSAPDTEAPIISGQSVWRNDTSTANVRFMSSEAGTYYYIVTDENTATSTDDLSGWTTGTSIAADTTITFSPLGLTAGGKYLHLVVKDSSNNVSDVLTFAMPQEYYYFENFEVYPLDTTIASGELAPITQIHNGTGNANQKVTAAIGNDSNKMLRLSSTSSWASDQVVLLDESALAAGNKYVFEGDVYALGTTSWQLRFSFTTGVYGPSSEAGVFFKNGNIVSISDSEKVLLTGYSANQWYNVKIEVVPSTRTYAVYVDGILLDDTLTLPSGIDRIAITSGHGFTAYYDNLEFYAVPLPAVCKILDTSYSSLDAALSDAESGDTIILLQEINHTADNVAIYKDITFDLNGYDLVINSSNTANAALSVGPGGIVDFIDSSISGDGEFNVNGAYMAIYCHDGGYVKVSNASASQGDGIGVFSSNGNIVIVGNVTGRVQGVLAAGSSSNIVVNGDVTASGDSCKGVYAVNGAIVNVNGDINATGNGNYGAYAESGVYGSLITIDGKINSDNIIRINDDVFQDLNDCITPTTKPDYLTFMSVGDSSNPQSTVWVKAEEVTFWTDGITSIDQYPFGGGDGSSAESAFEISTASQLAQIAYNVNNGNDYTGKYFKLMNDLDLAGKEWTPIGYRFYPGQENGFNGNFDGNNKNIINIAIGSSAKPKTGGDQTQAGLFGATRYLANIKDLHVQGAFYVNDVTSVGMLIGYSESDGVISGCSAQGTIVSTGSGDIRIGGLVGDTSGTSVIRCSSDVDISASNGSMAVGGLIGYHGAFSYDRIRPLDSCIYTGTLTSGNVPSYGGVGGIAGKSYGYTIIFNSVNKGTIIGSEGNIGGIVGIQHNEGIINCYSSGPVAGNGNNPTAVGGITGYIDWGKVYNCYDSGRITSTGSALVGALVGNAPSAATIVSNGYFDGTINDDLAHVRATSGKKYYLHEFTTEVMKGVDPGTEFEYADGVYANGEHAIIEALNGWIGLKQSTYPDTIFKEWDIISTFNGGYPYLTGTEDPGPEHDATLSALTASGVTLSPAFSPSITSYSANVNYGKTSVSIAATPANSNAVVNINGDNTLTKDVNLVVGSNTITILLIAEDLVTSNTYTININRATASFGGGSSTPTAPPPVNVTTETTNGKTTNKTTTDSQETNGMAEADITTPIVDALLQKSNETGGTDKGDLFKVDINIDEDIEKLDVTISQSDLARIAYQTNAGLSLTSSFASITFDGKALETIAEANSGGDVLVSASRVDKTTLSAKDRETVKDRPVYNFSVYNTGTQVTNFKGGKATVSAPYTLQPGENPESVVIYYLDDNGSLKIVRGRYDAASGSMIFNTTHFSSNFIIEYNPVSFNDVAANAWYKNAVNFIAARNITSGTSNNTFSPEAKLTRAEFVVLLMNAYQINTQNQGAANQIQNFSDAGNTYYTDYLLIAKALGIVNGIGNNLFDPEKEITRQEMFVMLYNALKLIDEVPVYVNDTQLSSFNDADKIADWANEALSSLVKTGTVRGYNNNLNPTATTTRAEIAQVLHNLLSK